MSTSHVPSGTPRSPSRASSSSTSSVRSSDVIDESIRLPPPTVATSLPPRDRSHHRPIGGIAALIAALALAGCTTTAEPLASDTAAAPTSSPDEPAAPEPAPAPAAAEPTKKSKKPPPPCRPPAKFRADDVDAGAYRQECQLCQLFTPAQVADEYRISSSNPVEVALEYAQKSYRPAYQQAGFEGCVKGFKLSGQL